MSVNVVAYYRVSTQKQGRSGLGLDAQRAAVRRFAEDECLTISAEYIEIETGKGADALERRHELANALKAARKDKYVVVVAKLDRLSRDVAFIATLMSQRVPSSLLNWVGTQIHSCCTFTPRWPSRNGG